MRLALAASTSPGAYLPASTAPKTSTEEDSLYHDLDMTDDSPDQETLDTESIQDDKQFLDKVDIAGDYSKYYESIRKYEEHHISKEKESALRQEVEEQNEAQRVEETLEYQEIASELLERDIALDKLENKEFYLYDIEPWAEEDKVLQQEKEARVAKQLEEDKKPFIE